MNLTSGSFGGILLRRCNEQNKYLISRVFFSSLTSSFLFFIKKSRCNFRQLYAKRKVTIRPTWWPCSSELIPGFFGMKRLWVFLLSPHSGWDAPVHRRLKKGTTRVTRRTALARVQNYKFKPWLMDPEFSALIIRPARLHTQSKSAIKTSSYPQRWTENTHQLITCLS